MAEIREKQLQYMEYIHRENHFRHPGRRREMQQFELLRDGDPEALKLSEEALSPQLQGKLSDNPVRNMKYLFVAYITICCRYCMDGGLDEERAYNISDLYIQKVDLLETEEEIRQLHREMVAFFLKQMQAVKKQKICSKPVIQCMDYIYDHLYEQIRLVDLAEYVALNESYLSVLFKKETGKAVSEYIRDRRVEAAEEMLRYSDTSFSDIANILAFSSQSHFINVFRKATGLTPKEYRDRFADGAAELTAQA